MSNKPKTPAQLQAEQLKNNSNLDKKDLEGEIFTQADIDAKVAEAVKDLNDENTELNNQLETSKVEAKTAQDELDRIAQEENAIAISPTDLKAKEEEVGKPLDTDYFVVKTTNKSVSFSGFQFFKGEKYAVTGRNKKAIETLIKRKLGKIVKK